MNTHVAPFDKLAVRRAVNYAISRKWLVHLAGGLARATENILPPDYPSYRAHTLYRHDFRKAKRLVAASGDRGKRVTVWNHDVPGDLPFTEYLVSVLNKLGFQRARAGRAGERLLVDPERAVDEGADRLRELAPGLSAPARLVRCPSRRPPDGSARGTTTTRISTCRRVTREIESLTQQPKLTRPVDAQWRRLDRKVMQLAPWAPFLNRENVDFFSARVRLQCYVNNVLYGFDYASICVRK